MANRQEGNRRRWGCWLPLALALAAGVLAAAVITLPWWGRTLAQRVMVGYLVAADLHPAHAEIRAWSWSELTVDALDMGVPHWHLKGGEVGLSYSPWGLFWERRAHQAWADGLLLEVDLDAWLQRPPPAADVPVPLPAELPFRHARLGASDLRLIYDGEAYDWRLDGWWGQPGLLTLSGEGPFAWMLEGRTAPGFASGNVELTGSAIDLAQLGRLAAPWLPPSLRIQGTIPHLGSALRWSDFAVTGWGGLGEVTALQVQGDAFEDAFDLRVNLLQAGVQGRGRVPESIELNWEGLRFEHSGMIVNLPAGAFGGALESTLMGRVSGLRAEAVGGTVAGPLLVELPSFDFAVHYPHGSLLDASGGDLEVAWTQAPAPGRLHYREHRLQGVMGGEARIRTQAEGMTAEGALQGQSLSVDSGVWQVRAKDFTSRIKAWRVQSEDRIDLTAGVTGVAVSGPSEYLPEDAKLGRLQAQLTLIASHPRDVHVDVESFTAATGMGGVHVSHVGLTSADARDWQATLTDVRVDDLGLPPLGKGELRVQDAHVRYLMAEAGQNAPAQVDLHWPQPAAVAVLFPGLELRFMLEGKAVAGLGTAGMGLGEGSAILEFNHGHGHWHELSVHALKGAFTAEWDSPGADGFDAAGRLQLERMDLEWADGAGELSGVAADIRLRSLLGAVSDAGQPFSFQLLRQGDIRFERGSGEIMLGGRTDGIAGSVNVRAEGFGGRASISLNFAPHGAATEARIQVSFDHVQLHQLAALFPAFDGAISGPVSGQLNFIWRGGRLILRPGELAMPAGTTGHFSFRRTGWLSGDSTLDLDALAQGREIHNILQMPAGAGILTELAMRNLTMEHFRLRILASDQDKPVVMELRGYGKVRDTRVPVVLTVPVGGDLLETLEMVLQLRDRLSAAGG